jgi:cholesterol transport system auxiliary component
MNERPMGLLRILVAAALVATLAACGGLFPSPPERQLYRPQPSFSFPAGLPHAGVALAVATPSAASGLDTRRIALTNAPAALNYYADAEWADSVPFLVRSALVEGFEASGAVAAVGPVTLGAHADVVLETAIRDFEARYSDPHRAPRVEVAFDLKLIALPRRQIVAAGMVEGEATATENKVPAIVAAFNTALGQAAAKAVGWTVSNPALSARSASVRLRPRFVHPETGGK